MKKRKKIIDPPSGWRYGFPAELPEGKSYMELLLEHNYPQSMFDLAFRNSRVWYEEVDEPTGNNEIQST